MKIGCDIDVNGGLTYSDNELMGIKSENWFIGWDYAHCGDYYGYEETMPESIRTYGKKWTTEEIIEECKNAIDQIIDFESKEIIEEPKKIEKIKSNGDEFYSDYIGTWISKNKTDAYCEFLMNKINELIDEINNLKEKKEK